MKLNIEFQNYKLLKDTKACLDGSNVYLVQGANEQGKTSFINGLLTMLQAENKTKQPVTIGEEKGKIALDLKTKGGKDFKMLFEFTDKKNKFTLISENQLMSKVTDIRAFLGYQSLTADEFISWGNTAEGRRKQRDIVLNLLPVEAKEKFVGLSNKEEKLYAERTEINGAIKSLEYVVAALPQVNKEDAKQIIKIAEYELLRNKLDNEIKDTIAANATIDKINYQFRNIKHICENLQEIGSLYSKDDVNTILQLSENNIIPLRAINELYKKRSELNDRINKLEAIKTNTERYDFQKEELGKAQEEEQSLTKQLKETRAAKDQLIKNSNFPIQDIEITDDGLMLKSGTDLLPFDINQVSTSRIMFIVAKIILLLNKHLPIIVMGRGEAFDQQKLADLSKFAEENDCLLIIDKVTDTAGIEIVGYENKE